jgi:glycosyltransferase involved in cell wall biosynthesis
MAEVSGSRLQNAFGSIAHAGRTSRVLFITYDFPPSLEIGAHACNQLARYLVEYDWEPVVLTVQEHYITNPDARYELGYGGRILRTRVIPHPLAIYGRVKAKFGLTSDQSTYDGDSGETMNTVRRWALSLLKTPDVYTGWILPASIGGLVEIRRRSTRVLLSSGPYWSNHLVGLVLSYLTRLPWVAHFRDPWMGIPQWKPVSASSTRIETTLERMVVRRAASVVCVTDRHAELLRQRYADLPPERFVTIPNGFDEIEWHDLGRGHDRDNMVRTEKFVITYAGSLYQRRSPLPLLRALGVLGRSGAIDLRRVNVDLLGECNVAEGRHIGEVAAAYGVGGCVTFSGPVSRMETLRRMAQSNLLLLLAEAQPFQIPGKTYEYLRAGRPILALTSKGAVAELLQKTGGAWVVDPTDERGVAAAVQEAYERWHAGHPGPMADPAVVTRFDRRLLAGRLAEVLNQACGRFPVEAGS